MWNKIKNLVAFKPDPLAVAYIEAIRKDYTRLGTAKWGNMKARVSYALDSNNNLWLEQEISKLDKEKIMVELNASMLCGSDDEDKKLPVSGSLLNTKQDLIDAIERSKAKMRKNVSCIPFKPNTFI
jgi:hypothetical protein